MNIFWSDLNGIIANTKGQVAICTWPHTFQILNLGVKPQFNQCKLSVAISGINQKILSHRDVDYSYILKMTFFFFLKAEWSKEQ